MTSVLAPKTYDGTDISQTASAFRAGFPSDGLAQTPPLYDQRTVPVAGGWPRAVAPQPQVRTFALEVEIQSVTDTNIQALKALFDPSKGEAILVATDGTNDWQMSCSVVGITHDTGYMNYWVVTLQATYGLWKKVTESSTSTSIGSGDVTKAISLTNLGNARTPLVIDATPTVVKGAANDQIYRAQVPIAWRAPRAATKYPVALTLDTATEVTAGRMLASGNDLRTIVDFAEVQRDLGNMNAAATKVWVTLNFSPKRSAKTTAAMTAGSPATGATWDVGDHSELPDSGVVYDGTEAIAYTGKSTDGKTLTGITRGVRNTTAASHSAATEFFWVEHHVSLVWGNSGATAPTINSDKTPCLDLANSSNSSWTWSSFATSKGLRPCEWVPDLELTNNLVYASRGKYASTTYVPTADGTSTGGTVTGAASGYLAIDDPVGAPDDDTTYIALTAINVKRSVTTTTSYQRGSIFQVQTVVRAKAISGTTVLLAPFIRQSGVDQTNGVAHTVTTSYANYTNTYSTNPFTGQPWTADDLSTVEFGFYLTNIGTSTSVRVTQMYLSVNGTSDADPATSLGLYVTSSLPAAGHSNEDTWSVAQPVGAAGQNAVSVTVEGDPSNTVANTVEIVGVDATGVTSRLALYNSQIAAGVTQAIVSTPGLPVYEVGVRLNSASTTAFDGFGITAVTLTLDSTQTPLVGVGGRESTYIHRWTLANGSDSSKALTVLFPSALNKKLTIDADAGTVTFEDAGVYPLPAVSLSSQRAAWLELVGGANSLTWSDPTQGTGALTLVTRYRDRRN